MLSMKTPARFVYSDGTAVETEVEFEPMQDDPEKIANASLHQRAAMMAEIHQFHEAINDIEELIDGYIDIDHNGNPNLAMRISIVLQALKVRHESTD